MRDLPITVATLPILSKAYYTAHDFDKTSLEPPLGSGAYKVGPFEAGTYVSYLRRDDYWGPRPAGQSRAEQLRRSALEYYATGRWSLKTCWREISTCARSSRPRIGRRATTSRPVKEGRVLLQTLPDERPSGAQGFFINTRRDKFKDVRVREALGLAFDFEWSNKNLSRSLYAHGELLRKFDMKAEGPPSPEELALLEPFRDKLPPAVFSLPFPPPVTDGSGNIRPQLRQAIKLLTEAGWTQTPEGWKNAKGETLTVEILLDSPSFEDRRALPQELEGHRH